MWPQQAPEATEDRDEGQPRPDIWIEETHYAYSDSST
jgi:hypothetical protein